MLHWHTILDDLSLHLVVPVQHKHLIAAIIFYFCRKLGSNKGVELGFCTNTQWTYHPNYKSTVI
jgi:hypothetical protein